MKRNLFQKLGDFVLGKGFYIVLFLCVAAIGISGYYLFSSLSPDKDPGTAVAGPAQVTVTPTPASASPAVRVTPTPAPQAQTAVRTTPAPSPTPAPTPAATPQPTAPTVFAWPVKGTLISEYVNSCSGIINTGTDIADFLFRQFRKDTVDDVR